MKLVREAISFQRYRDPKEALFGTYKPGKVYAWYFFKEDEPMYMMFIELSNESSYPLRVCEFAALRQGHVILQYPEFNNLVADSLEPLSEQQKHDMKWKLDHLDDEEQSFIRMIHEETNLVPSV